MKYLISLLSFFIIQGCTKSEKRNNNALNYALTSNVSTLDPAVSYDTVSAKVVYQIYETMYEYDYLVRPYQLKPLLAQDLPTVSDDNMTYTIKLKENISYHQHEAFGGKRRFVKAQDFINEIKRLAFKGTTSNGWWLFDDKIVGLNEFREKAKTDFSNFYSLDVPGLIAKDDYTLVIKLKKPYPQLKYALAMPFTTPMPQEIIDFYKNDLTQFAVGSGPFKLISWEKNSMIKLKRFESYHDAEYPAKGDRFANENNLLKDARKKIPFLDEINFHIMKEAQTRWLNFRNKNIDMVVLTKDHFPIALDSTGQLNNDFVKENIQLQIAPSLTYWWLAFNMTHPVLGKNLKLRQAIAHTINIQEYIKNFTNNIALKANSIYPPGILGYKPSTVLPYKRDLVKAKRLLKEAGYENGKGLPEFQYDVRGASTVSRQMGEFIAKELAQIGIKIKVNLNSFPGFLNKAKTGQLEMWQGGWAMDYPDPENTIQLLITKNHPPGPNSTYYSNPEIDELYENLFKQTKKERILEITRKVENTVNRDLPWIMQFYSRNYILHHGNVKNFRQSDIVGNSFKYIRKAEK